MAKKLNVPKKGTEKAPEDAAPVVKSPRENMQHPEERKRKVYERTTISVNPELYKEFKAYAATNDTTVTALLEDAMRSILGK